MLLLTSTSDLLKVVTGSALTIDVHASYMDYNGTVVTPGRTNTAITTATTTTVVGSPGSGVQRNVKMLTIANKDVASQVVTVQHTDGSTTVQLWKGTLNAGDILEFLEGVGFFIIPRQPGASFNYFSTADQTINAATTALLTGSLITIPASKLQIGTTMIWTIALTKTAAGTAANTFDVRVGTAGTTGDTSRLSFALPTATGVVDTGLIEIIATCRGPLSASGIFEGNLSMTHNLAATGLANIACVNVNVVSAPFDVTVANLFVHVSCTTAASTVLTFQQVFTEVYNL